jgi:mono/diheme cytochrome c family protein
MVRVVRWLFVSLAVLAALAAGALAYLFVVYPIADEPRALVVEKTPERLARGSYLMEHVAVCTDCHSERDFSRFSGPMVEGTRGKGGMKFGRDLGLPGEIVAPNITPYKLGSWSDGEIVRAITSGVTPEGRALFPLMSYPSYAQMCDEDLKSVVSYLRSFAPIENDPPRSELDFPVNLIVRTLPKPVQPPKACPNPNNGVELGKYLVTLAGCADCHTPHDGPDFVPGKEFAGQPHARHGDRNRQLVEGSLRQPLQALSQRGRAAPRGEG